MSKRHVYREGDRVRIVRSRFIKRVGYALHPNDLREEIERSPKFISALTVLGFHNYVKGRAYRKLLDAVCFAEVAKRGMGGRQRMLHYLETVPMGSLYRDGQLPDMAGQTLLVEGKRYVQTGEYFPPWGGYDSYSGEYDYEPGGLMNPKTHVLLNVGIGEIEACDVEPV